MSSLSSFVKLSAREAIQKEWTVLHDRGGFRASDVLMFLFVWLVFAFLQAMLRVPMRSLPLGSLGGWFMDLFWPFIALLAYWFGTPLLAALVVVGLNVYSRPVVSGLVALSNWRLLYYESGKGRLSRFHHALTSVNLKDIVGVHSNYEEGFWGKKNLVITVHTKHKDGITLKIGHTGFLGSLPFIGLLFRRNTMGPEATPMLSEAFCLIQENKSRVSDDSISY